MQNCYLLKIDKKEFIQVTWKGSEKCFLKNQKTLDFAFGNGSLSWKRENQKSTYPLHIRFKLKLIAFSENLIYKNIQINLNKFAFLHIFFLYPLNLEDYRYNCRSIVSDWFARLNEVDSTHWIIVYDSSRCKDKKIRASILEKIRTDFAKYLNRFVEINDSAVIADKNEFYSLVQSSLISSFNFYLNTLTIAIQKNKNFIKDENFSVLNVYKLCQFYWNLGLMENALHELDDLNIFLSKFIADISKLAKSHHNLFQLNNWLKCSKLTPFGATCPYLSVKMQNNSVSEDCTIIHLRGFVLAHQILLTFHMFFQRYTILVGSESVTLLFGENLIESSQILKNDTKFISTVSASKNGSDLKFEQNDIKESTNEMALQLRHNFVSFILRYTCNAFNHLMDDLIILKANYPSTLLHILIIIWHAEILDCCKHLANISEVESASFFFGQITYIYCNSLLELFHLFTLKNTKDFAIVQHWFNNNVKEESETINELRKKSAVSNKLFHLLFYNFSDIYQQQKEDELTKTSNSFEQFVYKELDAAITLFEKFCWYRHAEIFNNKLVEFLRKNGDKTNAFKYIAKNLSYYLNNFLKSNNCTLDYAKQLFIDYKEFLVNDLILLCNCYLLFILTLKNGVVDKKLNDEYFDFICAQNYSISWSNLAWHLPFEFPFRIQSINRTLICCKLNCKINLKIVIYTDFLFKIKSCKNNLIDKDDFYNIQISAVFKFFSSDSLEMNKPAFCCKSMITTENQSLSHLTCFLPNKFFSKSLAKESLFHFPFAEKKKECYDNNKFKFINDKDFEVARSDLDSQNIILNAVKIKASHFSNSFLEIELHGIGDIPGCFALDHLCISLSENIKFYLNYQIEITQSQSIQNILLFVNIIKPSVNIINLPKAPDAFFAGIVQRLLIEVNAGSNSIDFPSSLKVSVANKPAKDGVIWNYEAIFDIPFLEAETKFIQEIFLCLELNSIDFSLEKSMEYDLRIDWLNQTWLFPLKFFPIMTFKTLTSMLGECVLFELEIKRCDFIESFSICPIEVALFQYQNFAKDFVKVICLNPLPFYPIVINSSYRFVWQLPTTKIDTTISVSHFFKILYKIQVTDVFNKINTNNTDEMKNLTLLKQISQRSYTFKNKLKITIPLAEYEVCAHILSEKPQLVLCRIDFQCDLIVSLRALTSVTIAKSIIVIIEVDPSFWLAVDSFKIVHIKGSGIGQTNFSIIPKQVGFLPYPLIYIHRYINTDQNDRFIINETSIIGERLVSFNRNQGKQIHVLSQLYNLDENLNNSTTVALSTTKKSFKSQAKDKFQKLFELKD